MALKVKIDGEFKTIRGGEISGTFLPGRSGGYPGGVETLLLDAQDVTGPIGQYAFYNCSSLTSLTLPTGLTGGIESNAFSGCSSLTSLTLPPGMTGRIDQNAFYNCSSLTSLTLPPGMTGSIGNNAFSGCTSLTSLTLPPGMTGSIGNSAFRGCTKLDDLYIMSPTVITLTNTSAFTNCPAIIRVPENLVESYKVAPNWSVYADRIFPIED